MSRTVLTGLAATVVTHTGASRLAARQWLQLICLCQASKLVPDIAAHKLATVTKPKRRPSQRLIPSLNDMFPMHLAPSAGPTNGTKITPVNPAMCYKLRTEHERRSYTGMPSNAPPLQHRRHRRRRHHRRPNPRRRRRRGPRPRRRLRPTTGMASDVRTGSPACCAALYIWKKKCGRY